MTATQDITAHEFRVVTAEDADGGLRLSLLGQVDSHCVDLRDVVEAALRSEPPRVEIDLRDLDAIDTEGVDFLLACRRLAELLGVEYRLSRAQGQVAVALSGSGVAAGPSAGDVTVRPAQRLDD